MPPPSRKNFTRITGWTPGVRTTGWTVRRVHSAINAHATGSFLESALLADTMLTDDEIPGVLEKRVNAVLGSDFSLVVPEEGNKALAERIQKELEPQWWDAFPEGELDEFIRSYRMLGVAVGVLDWTQSANRWTPRARFLSPQYLRFDDEKERFFYSAREGEFPVTPGDGQWLLLTDGRRGWLRASVRALAVTWLIKQLTWRDWSRYNERHGLPIVKAMVPAIALEEDREQFIEDLENLNSEIVATLPTHLDESGASFDLQLLEATDRNWESFERAIARCDRKFQIHFLGQNLTTEIDKNGSRAAAEVHRGVERDKAKADAEKMGTSLREQAMVPWVTYNYAGATLAETSWPKWDTSPPDDQQTEAAAKKTFGEALTAIKAGGYRVANLDELAEKYNLKLEKVEITPIPAANAPENAPPAAPTTDEKLTLASKAAVEDNAGFIAGQGYADALVDYATNQSVPFLSEDVTAVLQVLEQAQDYGDLRQRLREKYRELSPEKFSALVEKYVIIAELAGRAAVMQDL